MVPSACVSSSFCHAFVTYENVQNWVERGSYTSFWNIIDFTAGVFPAGRVDPALDTFDKDYKPYSELDKQVREECASLSGLLPAYTAEVAQTIHEHMLEHPSGCS